MCGLSRDSKLSEELVLLNATHHTVACMLVLGAKEARMRFEHLGLWGMNSAKGEGHV